MGKFVNLTGRRFGRLVAVEAADKRGPRGDVVWRCVCDCGTETRTGGKELRSGNTKSCGCLNQEKRAALGRARAIDLSGQRFALLAVVGRAGSRRDKALWRVRCDCGNEAIVITSDLTRGHTRSCGCLSRERTAAMGRANRTHGQSYENRRPTPTYSSWTAMKERCDNPNATGYERYGGKGIKYDPRWDNFETFVSDLGPRPGLEYCLSRIDHDKNYEPGNVRWELIYENNREVRARDVRPRNSTSGRFMRLAA